MPFSLARRWMFGVSSAAGTRFAHHSAEIEGHIDSESLELPDAGERPLVIKGAGGLMVPLNGDILYIESFSDGDFQSCFARTRHLGRSIIHCSR